MKGAERNYSQKLYENLRIEILKRQEEEKFYSIRQLVIRYNLNINTILKVIKRLEQDGYLYAKKGKGYFIARKKWRELGDEKTGLMKNFHSDQKNLININLANGTPKVEEYPYSLYEKLTEKVLKEYREQLLGYQDIKGLESLRKILADEVEKYDIFTDYSNIIITSGTQLALLIIFKLFAEMKRNLIGIVCPSYPNSFNLMKGFMEIKKFQLKKDGWDLISFEKFLKKERIDLVYINTNFHNPTGLSWSEEKKKKMIELAEKYDFYIIEDDCFCDFYYTKRVNSIKSYDRIGKERVIYIKTYSKIIMPDLGIAMMILPPTLVEKSVYVKYAVDHSTSGVKQKILEYFITDGYLDKHLLKLKKSLKRKYLETVKLLSDLDDVKMRIKVKGGFFIWLELPDYITAEQLYEECVANGVQILPGNLFYLNGEKENQIRMSFIAATLEEIRTGVDIIKRILKKYKN